MKRLDRHKRRWKWDNKTDLKEIRYDGLNWILLKPSGGIYESSNVQGGSNMTETILSFHKFRRISWLLSDYCTSNKISSMYLPIIFFYPLYLEIRDCLLGTATRVQTGNPRFPGRSKNSCFPPKESRPTLESPKPTIQCAQASSSGVKPKECQADHSTPSSTEVNNEYIYALPTRLRDIHRDTLNIKFHC